MTRKTFGEKMDEENEIFKAMSKKEKKEYLEKKFPGLKPAIQTINEMQPIIQTAIQTINEMQPIIQPAIQTAIQTINEMQPAIQTIKEIQSLIPEIPQLEQQIELKTPIDLTTEIGFEQIRISKKQSEIAEKSFKYSRIAIAASIIVPIIVAIIVKLLELIL